MKYNDKYPGIAPKPSGYHQGYKSDHVSIVDSLYYTGRFYPCSICRDITPFVDLTFDYVLHVCSEECFNVARENHLNANPEQLLAPLIDEQSLS